MERSPRKVIQEIEKCRAKMSRYQKRLIELVSQSAKAEMEYRMALAKKQLELKDRPKEEGGKVQITILKDIAKGDPEVAELLYKRDETEKLYRVGLQVSRDIQAELNSLQSELKHLQKEAEGTY